MDGKFNVLSRVPRHFTDVLIMVDAVRNFFDVLFLLLNLTTTNVIFPTSFLVPHGFGSSDYEPCGQGGEEVLKIQYSDTDVRGNATKLPSDRKANLFFKVQI